MSYKRLLFSSLVQKILKIKKSPGVFKVECNRTLFASKKRAGSDTDKIHEKPNWPEAQSPEHPLLNAEKWVCPFGQHGFNQSLFCLISADTVISLWKNTIFLMENPRTICGKTQCYLLRLREDWRTCRTACRPVAPHLALVFFKKVLSLCPYHWLLETLAFRPSVNSLSWCIPLYLITLCTVFLNLMKVLHIWLYDVILRFVVTFSHLTLSDYSSFNQ